MAALSHTSLKFTGKDGEFTFEASRTKWRGKGARGVPAILGARNSVALPDRGSTGEIAVLTAGNAALARAILGIVSLAVVPVLLVAAAVSLAIVWLAVGDAVRAVMR